MAGRRSTAAWRLALPGILVLAVGSAVVMAAGFWLLATGVRARGDAWMEAEVMSLVDDLESAGGIAPVDLATEVRELELHEGLVPDRNETEADGLFFLALVGPDGRVVASATRGREGGLTKVLDALPGSLTGQHWVHIPSWEYPVRVVARRLPSGRLVVGGATPYADAELLETIRDMAVAGWLLMLVIATPVAWLAVRRVLGRVDRLAEVAGSISVDALGQRLPTSSRGDEIDHLAATFNALLDRAAVAVRQLQLVADALAHDLRTPLTVIRGTLEGALRQERPSEIRDGVITAVGEVDGLSRLVAATLDAAEAEAGALRITRSRVDLTALVDELVELYEPAAAERGLELMVKPGPVVALAADDSLLRRLVVNLLDNAVTHLPSGCNVTVEVRKEGGDAVLEVSDDGPGFPPGVAERAFERLVRGAGSAGSGLGLAIVRAAAVAHGGSVVLEQPAGGGSLVRVTLPAPARPA